jgi:heptosyltransferase II
MCTPVLRALHQRLPAARITAIARRGLDEVLCGLPFVDSTVVCEMKGLFGPQRLGKAIRQTDAEAVLLLPNSFRSAIAARMSGAAIRIGYDRDGRGGLLTHKIAPPDVHHPVAMIDYYARLVCFALGVEQIDPRVELTTIVEEEAAAEALLHDVKPPFVVLNPGANRADKRWPAELFAAAADRLAKSRGVSIVVSGAPGEIETIEKIQRAAEHPFVNLTTRGITLGSLKAVFRRAALLITNDTGPRHIAAALGTPVVTLFGPTDHRWTTLNYERERILLAEPFLPEELLADKLPKATAIDRIAVGDVVSASVQLLSEGAPPQAAGFTINPQSTSSPRGPSR